MNRFQLLQTEKAELISFIEHNVYVIYHLSSPSGNGLSYIWLDLGWGFVSNGEEGLGNFKLYARHTVVYNYLEI